MLHLGECTESTWNWRAWRHLVKDDTGWIGDFKFALYEDYSYTYFYNEGFQSQITKSFSGKCAVVVHGHVTSYIIPSVVTYQGEEYRVVALGKEVKLNGWPYLAIPNSVEVIECNSFCGNDVTLSNTLTIVDGDNDLYCFPVTDDVLAPSAGTFSNLNTLKHLHLGRNLRYPGEGDNAWASYAPFANGSFTGLNVTVGPNVTRIPERCFSSSPLFGYDGVKTLDLSNATSLHSIGNFAFEFCTSLGPNVNFGDIPLTEIGGGAFLGCTSLSRAFFFSNVAPTLGQYCFPENATVYFKNSYLATECRNHSAFTGSIMAYPDNMMLKYQTTDGMTINRGGYIYDSYETGYGILYFDNVLTSIGNSWFNECGSLFSISLPNTVTSIGEMAFSGCTCVFLI